MATKIQFRRGTAAEWSAANPIPDYGEPCFETDTGILRIGDGTNYFLDLERFISAESASGNLTATEYANDAAIKNISTSSLPNYTFILPYVTGRGVEGWRLEPSGDPVDGARELTPNDDGTKRWRRRL